MSYRKKIKNSDVIESVLSVYPKYDLVSGSSGWRGGPHMSSSISLHDNIRSSKNIFKTARYSPGTEYPFLSPTKDFPVTASVHFVRMRNQDLPLSFLSSEDWGKEHWDPIMGLYDYYSRFDTRYTTRSYDHYSLYFNKNSSNIAISYEPGGVNQFVVSSSFTMEAWVKPFLTSSNNSDFLILSKNGRFALGITGSTGRLFFSSSEGVFTASSGPEERRWSHVAVSCNSVSGSFRINLADAGNFAHTASFGTVNSFTSSLTVGAKWAGTEFGSKWERTNGSGSIRKIFHGLIGECRIWNTARSDAQISSSYNIRIGHEANRTVDIPRTDKLLACFNFNDGPKSNASAGLIGSGALELVSSGSSLVDRVVQLNYFNDRSGPAWVPNDNPVFIVDKTFAKQDEPIDELIVIHVPSAFYGRQIATGSFSLTCNSFSSSSHGLVRTIVDDTRGGLYISGSVCSSSLENKESYEGVKWNKVGNIFYSEGIAVISDPSLLDIGQGGASHLSTEHVQLSFKGITKIPSRTTLCHLDKLEANCTNNPTFYTEISGSRTRRHLSGSTYISSIGIYNSENQLVAIAKLAQPIKKRPNDRFVFKIRQDF